MLANRAHVQPQQQVFGKSILPESIRQARIQPASSDKHMLHAQNDNWIVITKFSLYSKKKFS
jgi:hypothetical protein